MAAAGVTAAKDCRPSTYFIEPLIAGLCAYVIGTNLSVLDPADQLGRTDAEWFWSWQ
jgi:hypothetical protein